MVEKGKVAVVHYVGRIAEGPEEGEVFDASNVDVARDEGIYYTHRDYRPMQIEVGEGEVFDALDDALLGMEKGDEATVEAHGSKVFGEYDPDEVVEFPRKMFDDPKEERIAKTDDGRSGWVTDMDDETVTIDFNHELSDTQVEFKIRVLDVLEEKRDVEGKKKDERE